MSGETGLYFRRFVRFRQIPEQQSVIESVSDKAITLEALVGIAGGYRNVASGHADDESATRQRQVGECCEQGQKDGGGAEPARGASGSEG